MTAERIADPPGRKTTTRSIPNKHAAPVAKLEVNLDAVGLGSQAPQIHDAIGLQPRLSSFDGRRPSLRPLRDDRGGEGRESPRAPRVAAPPRWRAGRPSGRRGRGRERPGGGRGAAPPRAAAAAEELLGRSPAFSAEESCLDPPLRLRVAAVPEVPPHPGWKRVAPLGQLHRRRGFQRAARHGDRCRIRRGRR